ncbi:hypothetical protein BLOT_014172, partial [Blomia tropicalis]
MKFSGMVYCLILNHFCEFQFKNPKDSTQNRIQIDSFFVAWILMKFSGMFVNPKNSTQNRNKKAFIRTIGKCNAFLWKWS